MVGILYFFVIIFANTVGSLSGMGGGVIIKPALDLIGAHSVVDISFFSTVAVFVTAIVSTLKQMTNRLSINWKNVGVIAIGSVFGGILGNLLFTFILTIFQENLVQLIQIFCIFFTLFCAFLYSYSSGLTLQLTKGFYFFSVGLLLGTLASFLGIGGGPINVALLMFCFSLPLKEATVYSVATILFSQGAKLLTIASTTGFSSYDSSILFFIIPAALIGGYLGAILSKILSEKQVQFIYQMITFSVLSITAYNGVHLLFS